MYDLIIELGQTIAKHGLSLSALGTAIFVLLKQRKVKRLLRKRLPALFKDDTDVLNYQDRQIRIENDVKAIRQYLGVPEWNAAETNSIVSGGRHSLISSRWALLGARFARQSTRRQSRMKAYLKKLGSRKFQAFLAITIPNMIVMFGFILGNIDLEGEVNEWMPAINLVIQAIVTAVYQKEESKIDVATVNAGAIPSESAPAAVVVEVSNAAYTSPEDAGNV